MEKLPYVLVALRQRNSRKKKTFFAGSSVDAIVEDIQESDIKNIPLHITQKGTLARRLYRVVSLEEVVALVKKEEDPLWEGTLLKGIRAVQEGQTSSYYLGQKEYHFHR